MSLYIRKRRFRARAMKPLRIRAMKQHSKQHSKEHTNSTALCMLLIQMKLTLKKAKYFMKDEKKASKVYKKLKLKKLSKDEKGHYKFFKKFVKSKK